MAFLWALRALRGEPAPQVALDATNAAQRCSALTFVGASRKAAFWQALEARRTGIRVWYHLP